MLCFVSMGGESGRPVCASQSRVTPVPEFSSSVPVANRRPSLLNVALLTQPLCLMGGCGLLVAQMTSETHNERKRS